MGLFNLFKKKDKNIWNELYISDVIIGFAINCIGKDKQNAQIFFLDKSSNLEEGIGTESVSTSFTLLNNGVIIGLSFENDKCFKLSAYLNNYPFENDINNLKLWQTLNDKEYGCFLVFEKDANKHTIHIESCIY
jgi:hypothetical protein